MLKTSSAAGDSNTDPTMTIPLQGIKIMPNISVPTVIGAVYIGHNNVHVIPTHYRRYNGAHCANLLHQMKYLIFYWKFNQYHLLWSYWYKASIVQVVDWHHINDKLLPKLILTFFTDAYMSLLVSLCTFIVNCVLLYQVYFFSCHNMWLVYVTYCIVHKIIHKPLQFDTTYPILIHFCNETLWSTVLKVVCL